MRRSPRGMLREARIASMICPRSRPTWSRELAGRRGLRAGDRGGAARPPTCARCAHWIDEPAGMVGLALRPADPQGRRAGAQSRPRAAVSTRSATSPSSSGRSTRPPWSAWRDRRCAAAAANMRRARGSRSFSRARSGSHRNETSSARVEERTARARACARPAARGAEAGDAGPADRRRRPRFQQSADPDHRRARSAAAHAMADDRSRRSG